MERRKKHRCRRVEFGQARQIHRDCELHAGSGQRLLRLRPDQEKGRHRIEFPRAGGKRQLPPQHRTRHPMTSQQRPLDASCQDEYRILRDVDLRDYLAKLPAIAAQLGGSPADWSISEVADGNLTFVFIVRGTRCGIAVKQALPYVRLVVESWPLPLSRSHYEHQALVHQAKLAPGLVPAVLHHDEALALIAMELLEPHIIIRKGLISGICYPRFVEDITTFLARTLFLSSDLAVPAAQQKEGIAAFPGNHAPCKITEDLIFTEPYFEADQNPVPC